MKSERGAGEKSSLSLSISREPERWLGVWTGTRRRLPPALSGHLCNSRVFRFQSAWFLYCCQHDSSSSLTLMGILSTLIYFQPSKLFSNLLCCSEITPPLQICFRLKDREVTLVDLSLMLRGSESVMWLWSICLRLWWEYFGLFVWKLERQRGLKQKFVVKLSNYFWNQVNGALYLQIRPHAHSSALMCDFFQLILLSSVS